MDQLREMSSPPGQTAVFRPDDPKIPRKHRRLLIWILAVFTVSGGVATPFIAPKIKEYRDCLAGQRYAEAMMPKIRQRLNGLVQLVESPSESIRRLPPWEIPGEFTRETILILQLPEIRAANHKLQDPDLASGAAPSDRESGSLVDLFAHLYHLEDERQLKQSTTVALKQFVELFDSETRPRVPLQVVRQWTERLLRRHVVVVAQRSINSRAPDKPGSSKWRTTYDAFFVDADNMTLVGTMKGFRDPLSPDILKTLAIDQATGS